MFGLGWGELLVLGIIAVLLFGMTAWDMETAQRFKLPYMAVIGNNSAMNQIRCGQIGKYGLRHVGSQPGVAGHLAKRDGINQVNMPRDQLRDRGAHRGQEPAV